MQAQQVSLSPQSGYRPDIDGLRAIAVLAVVLFHAFPVWVRGGFIGVDVFFVISGYLISTIILEGLGRNDFSFAQFYARRIRRIFPALLLVLAFCYGLGWFALLADEYRQLGLHIAAGAGFVSNLVLWGESGYFDNAADTKPLLHLWSLGVEEQFYLVWPILLWATWRRRLNVLTMTLLIVAASFFLNVRDARTSPVADFFSPMTRFWELLAGASLAWLHVRAPHLAVRWNTVADEAFRRIVFDDPPPYGAPIARHMQSAIGIVLILAGAFVISKERSFPGWWTLMPVAGAMLVIAAGPNAWATRKLLSTRTMVSVGLISFPLYLWHWPLLSFARVIFGRPPSPATAAVLVVASFVLAWLTYRLIERPVRFGPHRAMATWILVFLMILVGYIGFNVYQREGLEFRRVVSISKENTDLLSSVDRHKSRECTDALGANPTFCLVYGNADNVTVAVLGDSTGYSLSPGLGNILAGRGQGLINIGGYTCPPIRGLVQTDAWGATTQCVEAVKNAYAKVLKSPLIKLVILALFTPDLQYWGVPDVNRNAGLEEKFDVVRKLISADIEDLVAHGKRVIVTYDVAMPPVQARDCLSRPFMHHVANKCQITESDLIDRHPFYSLFDTYFTSRSDVCIFRQADRLMKGGTVNFFDESGLLLLKDTHHLTSYGSRVMAELLVKSDCWPR